MAEPDRRPVTIEELLVSSLAQTDALAKLMIENLRGQHSRQRPMCRPYLVTSSGVTEDLFIPDVNKCTPGIRRTDPAGR
jgi:hypothetical protein